MTKEPSSFMEQLLARLTDPDLDDYLAPGEKLPSTKQLATHYEVTGQTVYRTVALFKAMGYLEGQQGRGVFVRPVTPLEFPIDRFERSDRRDDPSANQDDWKAIVAEQGREASQDTPRVDVEPAPADIAGHLGVEKGTHVVFRRRVRRVDGAAFQIADSVFPTHIALDSPLMREEDVTMRGGVLAAIGHPMKRKVLKVAVWPPITPAEKERLELPEGVMVPVLRQVRIGYGADGAPVGVLNTVALGHLNSLVYEMED